MQVLIVVLLSRPFPSSSSMPLRLRRMTGVLGVSPRVPVISLLVAEVPVLQARSVTTLLIPSMTLVRQMVSVRRVLVRPGASPTARLRSLPMCLVSFRDRVPATETSRSQWF